MHDKVKSVTRRELIQHSEKDQLTCQNTFKLLSYWVTFRCIEYGLQCFLSMSVSLNNTTCSSTGFRGVAALHPAAAALSLRDQVRNPHVSEVPMS